MNRVTLKNHLLRCLAAVVLTGTAAVAPAQTKTISELSEIAPADVNERTLLRVSDMDEPLVADRSKKMTGKTLFVLKLKGTK